MVELGLLALAVLLVRLVLPETQVLPVALVLLAVQIVAVGVAVRLLRGRRRRHPAMGATTVTTPTAAPEDPAIRVKATSPAGIRVTAAVRRGKVKK